VDEETGWGVKGCRRCRRDTRGRGGGGRRRNTRDGGGRRRPRDTRRGGGGGLRRGVAVVVLVLVTKWWWSTRRGGTLLSISSTWRGRGVDVVRWRSSTSLTWQGSGRRCRQRGELVALAVGARGLDQSLSTVEGFLLWPCHPPFSCGAQMSATRIAFETKTRVEQFGFE